MAKRANYEDFLDGLHDSILCHILSFLPTRDAVRTSILSPRWRYLFISSMSRLDFKDCLPDPEVNAARIGSFKKFVERLFFSPKHQRLEYFRVHDLWMADDHILSVYNWLNAALWRGVKEIDARLFYADLRQLPTLLFVCSSLVALKLNICGGELEVPTKVCLPNLRTLYLGDLEFADGCSFHRLISGCPVLELLGLADCFINDSSVLNIHSLSLKSLILLFRNLVDSNDINWLIVIDAPSLVFFSYSCPVARGYALRNMESLEKADITISSFDDVDRERSEALLQGICNVQILHLSIIDHDAPVMRSPLDPVLAFNKLVELRFKNHGDFSNVSVTWILEFLHRTPNLKTLILDLDDADRVFESLPEQVPSCLLYHLKEISIVSFKRDTDMFKLVSYFLNHALVLKKIVMSVNFLQQCRTSILEKLLCFPKKSEKCEFVIR